MGHPKISEILRSLSALGNLSDVSHLVTVVLLTPSMSASCFCDIPRVILIVFRFSTSYHLTLYGSIICYFM